MPIFSKVKAYLYRYFNGDEPSIDFPIALNSASPFSKKVYRILLQIPYGETLTYGDIAKAIEKEEGRRMSSQAVGQAVGKNPIMIIVPCHRVVGAKRKLTGYAGGIKRKEFLLSLESKSKNS